MKRLWLSWLVLIVLVASAHAAGAVFRLDFEPPGREQQAILGQVLGEDFLQGVGPFPPGVMVSEVDLNNDQHMDMVAVQKGFCSNHACTFHFLLSEPGGAWQAVAEVESWAIPFIVHASKGKMCGLVIFDHITDDCLSCSPPKPVRLTWEQTPSGAGKYAVTGPVPDNEAAPFEPDWSWQSQK